ncbi:bifunctional glutamate N-acetyltransferase/amino-acid acetyltransferase ArgJ [Kineothrix sp. MSJ-39]|uniref:bifunctional glutamate N-acetyltransferase/amino-acid acetyltransferase ArgJ n=1 Tax=Kineothrix sp. MSJ-39 TaxID=2841533 RepID=UPI002ED38F55
MKRKDTKMELIGKEGFTFTEGGVCAAKGFLANGLNCGLNSDRNKNDLCLIMSETECSAAAVYTQNKVKGAPILVTKEHLAKTGGKAKAVIANSKNANTCNADGEEKAEKMCQLAAMQLGIRPEEVIVASTGVIGQILPIEPIEAHIEELAKGLTADGNEKAATAIMTTDTVKKEVAVSFEVDGKTCHVGGMAKGSGMIHPNMATTLNFVTTDVNVAPQLVQKALSEIVKVTYNCLSVDGDTSTNDMVCVLANGQAGNAMLTEEGAAYQQFYEALYLVLMNMTRMLAADGEGASKLLECTVSEAKDLDTAIIVAKSVICSPLFKCAMFGEDANWGRVLCAIGYAKADFPIEKVDVDLASEKGVLAVCRNGSGIPFSEEFAKEVLHADTIRILVNLHDGDAKATAWGCDLTYDYVKINGDYRS